MSATPMAQFFVDVFIWRRPTTCHSAERTTPSTGVTAFGCCPPTIYLESRPVIRTNANVKGVGSRKRKMGIA